MIKITAELCPFGDEEHPTNLGIMKIWNDGSGSKTIGNYGYKIFRKNSDDTVWKLGSIKGFSRLKYGVWDLLFLVLLDSVAYRNKK